MKFLIPLLFIALFACGPNNISDSASSSNGIEQVPSYDSSKAAELGADQYGMKTYVVAFLKRGPNPPSDSLESIRLQSAHMANIQRLAEEGKLVLAGPFYGTDSLRGIYVFDTNSMEEAIEMTNTDPAIQQGSLKMDLRLWYGSAALMEVNKIHDQISKEII